MEITINIDPHLYAKLEKAAARYREDVEELIVRAIEDMYE